MREIVFTSTKYSNWEMGDQESKGLRMEVSNEDSFKSKIYIYISKPNEKMRNPNQHEQDK